MGMAVLSAIMLGGCASSPPPADAPSADETYANESTPPAAPTHDDGVPAESSPNEVAPSPAPVADASGETRTLEAIAAFVKERREKIRPCYDAQLKKEPKLKGDLAIRFVLDPAGKVKSAEYAKEESTIDSPAAADCAIAELKTWQFPASSRGMDSTVTYPFNFNPRR